MADKASTAASTKRKRYPTSNNLPAPPQKGTSYNNGKIKVLMPLIWTIIKQEFQYGMTPEAIHTKYKDKYKKFGIAKFPTLNTIRQKASKEKWPTLRTEVSTLTDRFCEMAVDKINQRLFLAAGYKPEDAVMDVIDGINAARRTIPEIAEAMKRCLGEDGKIDMGQFGALMDVVRRHLRDKNVEHKYLNTYFELVGAYPPKRSEVTEKKDIRRFETLEEAERAITDKLKALHEAEKLSQAVDAEFQEVESPPKEDPPFPFAQILSTT